MENEKDSKQDQPDERRMPRYMTANPYRYDSLKKFKAVQIANPTKCEQILWTLLRNQKTGHKIRRQHVIANYITDFCCLKKKVVIEIDGKIHLAQKDADMARSIELNKKGFLVVRFTNEEVIKDAGAVVQQIKEILDSQGGK